MLFYEIYGVYYHTVAKLLENAINSSISDKDIRNIINQQAFLESTNIIEQAIKNQNWQVIKNDGTTPIKHSPTLPLTHIQKQWLKAISLDPRMQLFDISLDGLENVEPLFTQEDYCIFDKYNDGDPFQDENYIRNFRMILNALKTHHYLNIDFINKKGTMAHCCIIPKFLEYSEKDDKFRLITDSNHAFNIINLAKIAHCEIGEPNKNNISTNDKPKSYQVTFELIDERNTLERFLLHFSHFEKKAEKLSDNLYSVTISYNKADETEMIIRTLSFGPYIKVVSPNRFVDLIKHRLKRQQRCRLSPKRNEN